eukprot:m51a1_g13785 hypothetical protein (250) ;mRNA; r:328066-329012
MAAAAAAAMGLQSKVDTFVMPGDALCGATGAEIRAGPGIAAVGDAVIASRAGLVRYRDKQRFYYIDNSQRRYVPAVEDYVIGVVTDKNANGFSVDIGAAALATLPAMAFEGATKRNRPTLNKGSLVYARVVVANRDMEPELECMSIRKKAEGFGELFEGHVVRCSTGLCRKLMDPDCAVLCALGQALAFEVAVGLNGRVWVKAPTAQQTVVIANAITNSETLSDVKTWAMVNALVARIKSDPAKREYDS